MISELAPGHSPERVASATGPICFGLRDSDFGFRKPHFFHVPFWNAARPEPISNALNRSGFCW